MLGRCFTTLARLLREVTEKAEGFPLGTPNIAPRATYLL